MSNSASVNIQSVVNTDQLANGNKANAEWMSVQEASNATGLSMVTLRRYIKSGKIQSRRLGRTMNSKLELLIKPALLPDQTEQSEYADVEEIDDEDDFHEIYQSEQINQPLQATLSWMQNKLDEKDAKIAELSNQLTGANYRVGYLEMEKTKFEEQVLLLEDKGKAIKVEKVWTKILNRLTGK